MCTSALFGSATGGGTVGKIAKKTIVGGAMAKAADDPQGTLRKHTGFGAAASSSLLGSSMMDQ